jgi:TonB-dependent receptor
MWRFATSLVFIAAAVIAQPSATGIIEGRVVNPDTGENLERARITVEGTTLEAFSDPAGRYRLTNVPAGTVQVKAFRTGETPQTRAVTVPAGQVVQQDFALTGLSASGGDTVKLEKFVVSDLKEMAGAAIAINTQRFAPNIVNVIAADEFGPMATGNVGEVMKSMAGITLTQGGMGEPNTISINGVPSNNVPVTLNSFNFAQAGGSTTRTVGIHQVSLNNISRIEVSYTPTPETPGSALAGTVNMVPRNAFERSKPVYTASASLLMRDTDLTTGESPGPRRGSSHKILPGFDFSAIVPVNDRFGFTLSAATSPMYTPLSLMEATRRGTSAPTDGNAFPDTTAGNPYLSMFSVRDATRMTRHTAYAATLDYRLSRNDTLTFTMNYALFDWESNDRQLNFIMNRVLPGDFGPTFTHSAPGGATLQQFNAAQNVNDTLYMPTLTYRHNGPVWNAEAGVGFSHSERLRRDMSDGFFANVIANRPNVTLWFDDIRHEGPGSITVRDNATGAVVDPYRLDAYSLVQATSMEIDTTDEQRSAFASARRDLGLAVPVNLKAGVDVRQQIRDIKVDAPVFPFLGADGVAGGADNNAGFLLDEAFSRRDGPFFFPPIQWLSAENAGDLYKITPSVFGVPNAAARHNARTAASKYAEETISAAYVRADVHLLEGRLKLVGGLRAEQTNVEGRGDLIDLARNFQRNPNGSVILGPNGQPLPIATNPLEVAQLTHIERGLEAEKEYFRLFPSLNAAYSLRDNLAVRAGYYKSIGRPDFNQYAGSLTLPNTENPPSPTNVITVNNVAIKPWMADTVKVSLEYYFEGVGLISIGGFQREFKNFFGPSIAAPTPEFLAHYGLDPSTYERFSVSTQQNQPGTVRMTGLDFNYKQALTFLPHWARGIQVFANFNTQRATGTGTENLSGFIPRFGNWGISLSRPKFTLRARWNYRDRSRQAAVAGRGIEPGTYFWGSARTVVDLTGEYKLTSMFSVFANITNLNDARIGTEVAGPGTPEHASFRQRQNYGSLWLIGVRATY